MYEIATICTLKNNAELIQCVFETFARIICPNPFRANVYIHLNGFQYSTVKY